MAWLSQPYHLCNVIVGTKAMPYYDNSSSYLYPLDPDSMVNNNTSNMYVHLNYCTSLILTSWPNHNSNPILIPNSNPCNILCPNPNPSISSNPNPNVHLVLLLHMSVTTPPFQPPHKTVPSDVTYTCNGNYRKSRQEYDSASAFNSLNGLVGTDMAPDKRGRALMGEFDYPPVRISSCRAQSPGWSCRLSGIGSKVRQLVIP